MYFCFLKTNMKVKNGGRNRKYLKIAKNDEKNRFLRYISLNIDCREKSFLKVKGLQKFYKTGYIHFFRKFIILAVMLCYVMNRAPSSVMIQKSYVRHIIRSTIEHSSLLVVL